MKVFHLLGLLPVTLLSSCVVLFQSEPQPFPRFNSGRNPSPAPTTVANAPSSEIAALEEQVHEQINQYRASKNLPPLTLNPQISQQARLHSQDMAKVGEISHDGFEQRVKAIAQTIPYRGAAENVASNRGYNTPVQPAVEGWINSPGHRKNIEGNYDLTGVGIVRNPNGEYYLTQIFIRTR